MWKNVKSNFHLKEAVQARHSSLKNVYCFADGLKLPFESCDGLSDQSMYYNGHYISNHFVFAADGRIINAITNVPGSVRDSTLAICGGTYTKLKGVFE